LGRGNDPRSSTFIRGFRIEPVNRLSFFLKMPNQDEILNALKSVKYPGFSRDIVSFGLVKEIQANADAVSVQLQLTSASPEAAAQIKADCETALRKLPGIDKIHVEVRQPAGQPGGQPGASGSGSPDPWAGQNRVAGVKKIIAVASGKGGVGKSTVAVNLACALKRLGQEVGLLDLDIYGPSIPLMMGLKQRPQVSGREKLVPPVNHGIRLMSIGFLLEDDQPVIWRGPMISKTIQQFLFSVEWDGLDCLLIDLPPGTGDAQLSLCQTVPLDGGVVVTTPQEASVGIVRKGIAMFQRVNVPVLGIVENMSYYVTPTGDRVEIFGHGGGRGEAARQGVPFLGEIPLFTEIREGGDLGVPVVAGAPDSAPAKAFMAVAEQLLKL
jgi:ATP-binding protein involved in chromosome partitioning